MILLKIEILCIKIWHSMIKLGSPMQFIAIPHAAENRDFVLLPTLILMIMINQQLYSQ